MNFTIITEKQVMEDVIRRVKDEMIYRRYSKSSIRTYLYCLRQFLQYFNGQDIEHLSKRELRTYFHDLIRRGYSKSTQNQQINAIKFYYEKVQGRDRTIYHLERPTKEVKLPTVLGYREVQRILKQIHNLKQKCILSLIYSCGLRVSEAINLEVNDIDSQRMVIVIRGGKGCKDRLLPLPEKILTKLREYYLEFRPVKYLFYGQGGKSYRYSATSIRKVLYRATRRVGIAKNVTPHTLRHSYATHMLEAGIDIRYIQELLGHNNVRTTQIYTHLSRQQFRKLGSPIDSMNID